MIQYQVEKNMAPKEFKELLINSTLGERRPIDDDDRITAMVNNANLIITAREDGKLIGVARSLTDYAYCTYLSDLAVTLTHQHQGIGKELIKKTKQETPKATLILLSAPKAKSYYPAIGMTNHTDCFLLKNEYDLK